MLKKILEAIIIFICISMMIFSGIRILDWLKENKQNKDIIQDISNTVSIDENLDNKYKYDIDFESLKQKNNDIIAWLKVNGTEIEYPVVKTTNNDYYMNHSLDKSYNSAGWIFIDYRNKLDGEDKNMVIYGHNRRDGSIFGTLKNILTEEWYNNEENYLIPFITENDKSDYQVFSVYRIEKEDYYITTDFKDNEEYEKFLDTIKSRSIKDFGVEVTSQDQIITLSTCADNNKYRVVLHAKKQTRNKSEVGFSKDENEKH